MSVDGEELRPFRIAVPDSDLADLRDRLDRVRWAPEPRGGAVPTLISPISAA